MCASRTNLVALSLTRHKKRSVFYHLIVSLIQAIKSSYKRALFLLFTELYIFYYDLSWDWFCSQWLYLQKRCLNISFRATNMKDWKSKASVWSLFCNRFKPKLACGLLHLTDFMHKWARDACLAYGLWLLQNVGILNQKRKRVVLHMYCSYVVVCN